MPDDVDPALLGSAVPKPTAAFAQPSAGMGDLRDVDRTAGLDTPPKKEDAGVGGAGQAGQPQAAPAPTPSPGEPGFSRGPKIGKDLATSTQAAMEADRAKAKNVADQAAESLKLQQDYEVRRQAAAAQWQQRWEANQARSDQLANDIATSKVDPNQFWNNAGTAGKISASIGMILGGIGGALTHGPNQALEVVQRSIDRDIDAQKTELGKKQNLLSHYMQQGHDIQQAAQLAKADALAGAAGQLRMVATKYAGPEAQVEAQAHAAAWQRQSALDRQAAYSEGLKNQLTNMDAAQKMLAMKQQKATLDALGQYLKGGAPSPLLPKEIMERAVTLPTGQHAFAGSKEDADEAKKTFEAADTLKDKMARYRAMLNEHPHGIFQATDKPAYQQAKALRADILSDMSHLHGLSRMSDVDLDLWKNQVPDITDVQLNAGHQKVLNQLGSDVDAKVAATMKNRLSTQMPTVPLSQMVRD